MKDREQNDLLSLGGMMKGGYSSVIANAGKVIATVTLIVAVLVTFTDVAFSDLKSESFTSTLAVMLMSAYLMYFSLEDTGEREGEESEEYSLARERYLRARSKITPDSIEALRSFCLDYSEKELEYRRLSYLGEKGYSKNDLTAYRSGKQFPRRAKRAFRKAESLRAIRLSPSVLLSRTHGVTRADVQDPIGKKLFGALTSLIPSTVCMVFTVSVMLTAKENMTVSTVLDSLIKLSALPIVGLKGLLDGYSFAREDKSAWLNTKARLLESFLGEQ